MLIYVVRHGETRANVEGYIQGWSDDPLNPNGKRLAIITGQGLRGIKIDCCISSPLTRAKETAHIILKESDNNIPIEEDDRIKEINFGTYEMIKINSSEILPFFQDPFTCPCFPNGEDVYMVMKRTQAFIKELIKRDDGKRYIIVTHGCSLRAMLNPFYLDPLDYWHGHIPYNCSMSIIEAINGKATLVADDVVLYSSEMITDRYTISHNM